MKIHTPDELHKAISDHVVTLNPHPSNAAVVCMTADASVVSAMRSMPTAPQLWYSATDRAFLVKRRDVERLVAGLRSFGGVVVGSALPASSPSAGAGSGASALQPDGRIDWPSWCGQCDQRTRQRPVASADPRDQPTLIRCPACHPLREQPLRPVPREAEPQRLADDAVVELGQART